MSWWRKKLTEVQNKPYKTRLRILRFTIIATAILIILIWFLTLKFRQPTSSTQSSKFAPLLEGLKKLKDLKPR